ncbi:hypothetical protein FRB93_013714 [Tulasnella sp. JGI-2019a]|nr:hypothetical protein FRB93_013714 [Tulasnella sp. JGI-2019a]
MDIRIEAGMNVDIDTPISNVPAVTDFALTLPLSTSTQAECISSMQSTGSYNSVVLFKAIPVNGLPHLALASRDFHQINILKQVAYSYPCDVYQGLHAPTRLKLALRCPRILEGTVQGEEVKRRYKREAKTWSSLNHVNVLPFYGVVETSSITFLAAPWIAHGDLSQFVAGCLKYSTQSPFTQGSVFDPKRDAFSAFDEVATVSISM